MIKRKLEVILPSLEAMLSAIKAMLLAMARMLGLSAVALERREAVFRALAGGGDAANPASAQNGLTDAGCTAAAQVNGDEKDADEEERPRRGFGSGGDALKGERAENFVAREGGSVGAAID